MLIASAIACLMWWGLLLAPWQPWRTRERLEAAHPGEANADPGAGVTAIIPARNEAGHIEATLQALRAQSAALHIIVVDDQSTDATAAIARSAAAGVQVVSGAPLPAGWTGKLWALHQGTQQASTPFLLLLDADIRLAPGVLAALRQRQRTQDAGLVSVMATLAMQHFWERLLMPAFIYFFKLLYPFALANGPARRFSAAAGGCMFVRRDALAAAGGFERLRGAVIDDCTLARHIKQAGYRIWIGLSRAVVSTRRYPRLADTWSMVARTAFTQLNYSIVALVLCTVLMVLSLTVPVAGLLAGPGGWTRLWCALALVAMVLSYLPVVRYYGLPWIVAFSLPVVGALFLAMTWSSAINAWRGVRARWKDRDYGRAEVG